MAPWKAKVTLPMAGLSCQILRVHGRISLPMAHIACIKIQARQIYYCRDGYVTGGRHVATQ